MSILMRAEAVFLTTEPGDGSQYSVMVSQPGGLGQAIHVVMVSKAGSFRGAARLEFDQVKDWCSRVTGKIESGETVTRAMLGDFYTQHVMRQAGVAGVWEAMVMILIGASVAFLGAAGSDLSVIGHLYRDRLLDALAGLSRLVRASEAQSMVIHLQRSDRE